MGSRALQATRSLSEEAESSADEGSAILRKQRGASRSNNVYGALGASQDGTSQDISARAEDPSDASKGKKSVPAHGQSQIVESESTHGKQRWFAKLLDKYGSVELENKGSVARDHLALERTFLAWLRTSLSFASIGVAITQLFRLNTATSDKRSSSAASTLQDNTSSPPTTPLKAVGKPLGATFLGISILILLIGFHRYFESQHYVIRGKFPASRGSIILVSFLATALIVTSLVVVLAIAPAAFENGVDVRQIKHEQVKEIRQALLDHLVIFFREQDLTPAEFLAFASQFGEPVEYPFVKGLEGYPEIIQILKKEDETVNFGGVWHSDTTYLDEPPMGSVLLAREIPSHGGDTMWANQYLAYETLSEGLRRTLGPLRCVQSSAKAAASKTREDRVKDGGQGANHREVSHPAVRTHPETGRKALFMNVAHTTRFEGWTEGESAPLLQYLFRHQVQNEFTCRMRWEPSMIAFWDNRCTQHYPLNDYHGHRRRMHRITLAGDVPR